MEKLQEININQIIPNPYQPRFEFSEEKLQDLASSIKENGLIQPIIVRESSILGYELLAGERRLRACKLLGLHTIPAIVKSLSDKDMIFQAIIENLQREDLNPIEEALSYQELVNKGMLHEEIANIIGKSRPYITNSLRLLQLAPPLIEAIKKLKLSPGHARLLFKYSREKQEEWLDTILKNDLSVRQVEKLQQKKVLPHKKNSENIFIKEEEEKISKKIGTKVDLKIRKNQSGELKIYFQSFEEYERIINSLK